MSVGCWIVFNGVDTVQYAVEAILALAEQWIQTLAELRRQNLLGIAWTHGTYRIGEEYASTHKVYDVCQLRHLRIDKAFLRDARDLQDSVAEDPLIGKVVNGVHSRRRSKERIIPVDGFGPVRD